MKQSRQRRQPAKERNARGLFNECLSREKLLKKAKFLELKEAFVTAPLNRPLHKPDPSAAPEVQLLATYLVLRTAMKEAKNNEERWVYLARWLKQEGICEPKQFLPSVTYRCLKQAYQKHLKGISFTDPFYFELVRTWEPYFKDLLNDRKKTPDVDALRNLGYDSKSVDLLIRKPWRSPVELACEWLAQRGAIRSKRRDPDPARILRNAYSRVKTKASSGPFRP
jgi:hypothetical protein